MADIAINYWKDFEAQVFGRGRLALSAHTLARSMLAQESLPEFQSCAQRIRGHILERSVV